MDDKVIEFLQQSNYIENEPSTQALEDAVEAWHYLITKDELTTENILHTHRILMQTRQDIPDDLKGAWRHPVDGLTGNVRVGAQTKKPWATVPKLMEQWITNANDTVLNGKEEDREFLKELIRQQHVSFEEIHPFIDGNGRIGRILMNWQLVKLDFEVLVIEEREKQAYYAWFK